MEDYMISDMDSLPSAAADGNPAERCFIILSSASAGIEETEALPPFTMHRDKGKTNVSTNRTDEMRLKDGMSSPLAIDRLCLN
jgi:hypothetical protein